MVVIIEGTPAETVRILSTDEAAAFTFTDRVQAAFLTFEGGDCRVSYGGTTPTQGANGVGHLFMEGDTLYLRSWSAIKSFRYISAASGVPAILQVTLEY